MNLEYYQDYFCFKLSQNNTVSDINYLLLVTLGFDGGFVFVFGHGLFRWWRRRHIRLRRRLAPRIGRNVGVIRLVEHRGGCRVVGREHATPVARRNDLAVLEHVGAFANTNATIRLDVEFRNIYDFCKC